MSQTQLQPQGLHSLSRKADPDPGSESVLRADGNLYTATEALSKACFNRREVQDFHIREAQEARVSGC